MSDKLQRPYGSPAARAYDKAVEVDEKLSAQMENIANKTTHKARSIVLLGDSITANNSPYLADDTELIKPAKGYFTQAQLLMRQAFDVLNYAGVSGDTTSQILSRVDDDVIAFNPNFCFEMSGVNDLQADLDASIIIDNKEKIYEKMLNVGITVIAGTILPSIQVNSTPSRLESMNKINNWIREYCSTHDGIILCNWDGVITNQTTGDPLTGVTEDGLHPSYYGAGLIARKIKRILNDLLFDIDVFSQSNFDDAVLTTNQMMLGDVSGVATNWSHQSISGTASFSKVTRTDNYGEWQQIAVTDGNHTINQTVIIADVGLSVGDSIFAQCEFESDDDWANDSLFQLTLNMYKDGFVGGIQARASDNGYIGKNYTLVNPIEGALRTVAIEIPEEVTQVIVQVQKENAGTVRLGRIELYKA